MRTGKLINSTPKTLIGVLSSHDNPSINTTLSSLFTYFYNHPNKSILEKYHFVFTGGTYDRLFFGSEKLNIPALDSNVAEWLHNSCGVTGLPSSSEGGVILLSYLISKRQCSILWPFYEPHENQWLRPEYLAFMRLCDQWHVKRFINRGSIMVWFDNEAEIDATINIQSCPPALTLGLGDTESEIISFKKRKNPVFFRGNSQITNWSKYDVNFSDITIALISHDAMKARMVEFAMDFEPELNKFKKIIATRSTGREVMNVVSRSVHNKMVLYHSGPKGGDIEIATAILYDKCQIVIFFVDTLNSHSHIDDIRVIFQACMIKDQIVLLTNEANAREFMSRVIRGKTSLTFYK